MVLGLRLEYLMPEVPKDIVAKSKFSRRQMREAGKTRGFN
jgi:hypothetical protein